MHGLRQALSWCDNKGCQKNTDARWTKKHSRSHFAYKNHIQIDHDNKLIRDYQVTDASVHDAQVFADLPDDSNTSKDVWADSAYRSEEKATFLKGKATAVGCKANAISRSANQSGKVSARAPKFAVGSNLCLEHSAIYAAKRFLALALRAQA